MTTKTMNYQSHSGKSMTNSMFILDSLTAIGGSERKAVRIVNALAKRDHKIHLAYLNSPDTLKSEIDNRVKVTYLGRRGKFDWEVLQRLRLNVVEDDVKFLFCMNLYPALYGLITRSLMGYSRFRCHVLINKHNFVPKIEELKMVVYMPVLQTASKIVFGCQSQQSRWTKRYFLNSRRCSYIYNGVDCSWFSPEPYKKKRVGVRQTLGFLPNDIVVANVAAFLPKKSQSDLIVACARLAEMGYPVRLALAGDGPERTTLSRVADEMGFSDRTHFLGQVLDIRPLLSACDIFSLSSVAENFSNAALEAMSMEKPVVLSDVGGAAEMVKEGENGFLFPPSDIATLTSKLKLLFDDTSCRQRMGREARKIAVERFSFSNMIDEYERLMTEGSLND
jgi:glycosyltransferase involved in cell wall biosynthesis